MFLDWQLWDFLTLNFLLSPTYYCTMHAAVLTLHQTLFGYKKSNLVSINRLSFAGNIGFFIVYSSYVGMYFSGFDKLPQVTEDYKMSTITRFFYIMCGFILSIIVS